MYRLLVRALFVFPTIATCGCQDALDSPARVDGVRVMAVQAEPASGAPGAHVRLRMLTTDGGLPVGASPRLEIAWMGGCNNPTGRQFFGCYPLLRLIAQQLAPKVLDTPARSNFFSTTTLTDLSDNPTFDLQVPSDILSSAPRLSTDAQHFGVSYTFFAVCAGELRPRPDWTDRVPIACVDPQTGADVAPRRSVTGFSTLFTYEGSSNANPALETVRFADVDTSARCESDVDCSSSGAASAACGPSGTCIPKIKPCSPGSCATFRVDPIIDPSSAEPIPGGREIVWASYYANLGAFDSAVELVNDRGIGWIANHAGLYTPPPNTTGPVNLWVTVADERGGVAWTAFQVVIGD